MEDNKHIILTSHPPSGHIKTPKINWGAKTPKQRGPVIGSFNIPSQRNVIGVHSGAYGLYRALAIASGSLNPIHRPDLSNTNPTDKIGPFPQWSDPSKIVSMDPYGHMVGEVFASYLDKGFDIRPTIAITKARINIPEFKITINEGNFIPDGEILKNTGEVNVIKAAIEPVWYLTGIAKRLDLNEMQLRRSIFEYTGGMFPELITRPDLKVFLPPIGGISLYIMGNVEGLWKNNIPLTCRVHDECNGSDVFGSDICTCRPYLVHGLEGCVKTAQCGGAGLIVYNRKEGRALGEVTKFLVYNARKRNPDGDLAEKYFQHTECVAGVQDARFQDLMPDVLHWLGIKKIDNFISMSDMKYNAITKQKIKIINRVAIPERLIPDDAQVEIIAKKAAGYFSDDQTPIKSKLVKTKGRDIKDY